MKTDTIEQIAAQLIGCCFMPPDHDDIPDDLEREAARQTAQEILAIAIKSPEAAEYCRLNDNTPILIMEARAEERQRCIDAVKKHPTLNDFCKGKVIKAMEEAQSDE